MFKMVSVALVAAFFMSASSVKAEQDRPGCNPRAGVLAYLDSTGEVRIANAIDSAGNLLEVFAQPKEGTFSILRTSPKERDVSCFLSVGDIFHLTITGVIQGYGV